MLATISDKKIGVSLDGSTIDHFAPVVLDANDYYPFGSLEPGRTYDASGAYRYGFNGKENDNEVKGNGDQQDYGMRIYDPRVGRFLSLDPLTRSYSYLSPYQFAENSPIRFLDLDGRESLDALWKKAKEVGKEALATATAAGIGFGNAYLSNQVMGGGRRTPSQFQQASGAIENHKLAYAIGQLLGDAVSIEQGTGEGEGGVVLAPETGGLSLTVSMHGASVVYSSLKGTVATILDMVGNDDNNGTEGKDNNSSGSSPSSSPSNKDVNNKENTVKAKDLKLGHNEETITKSKDYQDIKKLSDKELVESVLHPKEYDPVRINTKTGKLVDGNTRIYEIQRRGLNVDVPVEKYTPDDSGFPDLQEPPKLKY